MKCRKCGGNYPCPEHTAIIDQKTGDIRFPYDITEKQKQRIRNIRDTLKEL